MIQTICHVQTQSVNIKFVYPSFDGRKDMLDHLFIAQVQFDQIIVSFPALIP